MVLEQLPLGLPPKAFEGVDMDLASVEAPLVIDREWAVATRGQRTIAQKFIRVHQRSPFPDFNLILHQCLGRGFGDNSHGYPSAPLQDAENGHGGLDRRQPCGDLQLEQLHQPQPGCRGQPGLAHPGPGEQAEGIPTTATPLLTTAQPVDCPTLTGVTNQPPIFVSLPPQHPKRCEPAPYQAFKGLNPYRTNLILVPDALRSPRELSEILSFIAIIFIVFLTVCSKSNTN